MYKTAFRHAQNIFYNAPVPEMFKVNPRQFWKIVNPSPISTISLVNSDSDSVDDNQCASMLSDVFNFVFTQEDLRNFSHTASLGFSAMSLLYFTIWVYPILLTNLNLYLLLLVPMSSI